MEVKNLSLNQAIARIRVELQNSNLRKSGNNKFAGFDYFELADFLPTLNTLMLKYEVNDNFSITDGEACLTLIKENESQKYAIPFVLFDTPLNKQGGKSMQDIQYLGALNTYYKRYCYLNAFGITDGDVIDAIDNSSFKNESVKKQLTPQPKDKIQQNQIDLILSVYKGPDFIKLLSMNNLSRIEDMPIEKANELINKITEKNNDK